MLQKIVEHIKCQCKDIAALEIKVDDAFEKGDLDLAEELDAVLADSRFILESYAAQVESDYSDDIVDNETGLEEELAGLYIDILNLRRGQALSSARSDEQDVLDAMRDAAEKACCFPLKGFCDIQILAAAKDAFDAKQARRKRILSGPKTCSAKIDTFLSCNDIGLPRSLNFAR